MFTALSYCAANYLTDVWGVPLHDNPSKNHHSAYLRKRLGQPFVGVIPHPIFPLRLPPLHVVFGALRNRMILEDRVN
jgi:hypothetical protein